MCELCNSISDDATDFSISLKIDGEWDAPKTFAGISAEAALFDAGMMTMLNSLISMVGPFLDQIISEAGSALVETFRQNVSAVKVEETLSDQAIFRFLDDNSL